MKSKKEINIDESISQLQELRRNASLPEAKHKMYAEALGDVTALKDKYFQLQQENKKLRERIKKAEDNE